MKIDLGWLKEFIPLRAKATELADQLSMAGLEVEAIEQVDGETVLTLGITPNRGDCLSLLGIAREVSALQGKKIQQKITVASKGAGKIADLLKVQVFSKTGCPRYMARAIRGVQIKPSPDWLQKRLLRAGLHPVNNVVDCTNYVMWELGQPLHAFDYRFLRGKQIVVRQEKLPVKFKTLDGGEHVCEPNDLFICDGEGPVALAGIMGGANSEIRDDTKEIVLESAYFNPQQIHRTRKRLKISTDSSYRFERGVDPNGVVNALHRVTKLILETAGGAATVDWVDLYPKKIKPAVITFPLSEIGRILGIELTAKEVKWLLERLGLQVHLKGEKMVVQVPTHRPDITIPVDLVEEVARLKGYDKITATLPKIQMNLPKQPQTNCAEQITIDCCNRLGFSEACHLSFTSLKKASLFCEATSTFVSLQNPLSEEHALLRPTLIPSLLDAVAFNLHRQKTEVKLFELKSIFKNEESRIAEIKYLGAVATGEEWPIQWELKRKGVDYFTLKGLLEGLTRALHIPDLEYKKEKIPDFLTSTSASGLYFKGKNIGWIGLLNSPVLKEWEIGQEVYAFELRWDILAKAADKTGVQYKTFSKYPYIERDVALILDQVIPVQSIEKAILQFNNPWIQKIQVFDLFKGGNLSQNKKSIAFRLRYGSSKRTLTNEEVNEVHTQLITRLEQTLSAQLRT